MDKRNHLIDLLRFLAAAWVAIFHFNGFVNTAPNWYRIIMHQGNLGVPVFFVVSGYCINYAANHSPNAKEFIIKRFFRIYPSFWFSIIAVLFSLFCYRLYYGGNPVPLPKTIPAVLATISLFTYPFSKVTPLNMVYWTLTYEVFFYLVIFITLFFSLKYRVFGPIILTICTFILPLHDNWVLFFLQYWPSFCLGLVTYRLLHHFKQQTFFNFISLLLCLSALFYTSELKYIAACIISASLIAVNHFKPLRQNPLSKLGDYSYAIYLLHVPVGITLLGFIKQYKIVQTNICLDIAWDMVLLAIIIYLSKLMHDHIEIPAIRFGKRLALKVYE